MWVVTVFDFLLPMESIAMTHVVGQTFQVVTSEKLLEVEEEVFTKVFFLETEFFTVQPEWEAHMTVVPVHVPVKIFSQVVQFSFVVQNSEVIGSLVLQPVHLDVLHHFNVMRILVVDIHVIAEDFLVAHLHDVHIVEELGLVQTNPVFPFLVVIVFGFMNMVLEVVQVLLFNFVFDVVELEFESVNGHDELSVVEHVWQDFVESWDDDEFVVCVVDGYHIQGINEETFVHVDTSPYNNLFEGFKVLGVVEQLEESLDFLEVHEVEDGEEFTTMEELS